LAMRESSRPIGVGGRPDGRSDNGLSLRIDIEETEKAVSAPPASPAPSLVEALADVKHWPAWFLA
jgi:hypothetical protein